MSKQVTEWGLIKTQRLPPCEEYIIAMPSEAAAREHQQKYNAHNMGVRIASRQVTQWAEEEPDAATL